MVDIPRAQPLPTNVTTANLGQGLAMGYATGTELAQKQQAMAMEQQKALQEKQQNEMKQKLEKFGMLTNLYKNTSKKLRPRIWPEVANQSNALLGTKFDPSVVPESADDAIDAAHQEIQLLLGGEQSYGDTMKKLGMLSIDLDEETRKAIEASKGFLTETPEAQKLKNEGKNTGTYDFKGYDPSTKQAVFSFSKAPVLVDTTGKQVSGPIQSKGDFDKTTSEMRDLDAISNSVNDIESMLNQIPSGAKGGIEAAIASIPGGNILVQKAAQYQDQLPIIARTWYRKATGDPRISNEDAEKAALPFMPKLQDTAEIRTAKIALARAMLKRRKEALMQGIFEIPFDPNDSDIKTKPNIEKLSTKAKDFISKLEGK